MPFIVKADGSKVQIAYIFRPENSGDAVITYSDASTETVTDGFAALSNANPYFIAYNGDSGLANNSKSHRINPACVTHAAYVGTEVTLQVAGAGTKVVDRGTLNGVWDMLPV